MALQSPGASSLSPGPAPRVALIPGPASVAALAARLKACEVDVTAVELTEIEERPSTLGGRPVIAHAGGSAAHVCHTIRELGRTEALIAVFEQFDPEEKARLFSLGADAYESAEVAGGALVAFIAQLVRLSDRACCSRLPEIQTIGAITLDRGRRTVTVDGQRPVALEGHALKLLDCLFQQPGEVVPYALLRRRWGSAAARESNIEAVTVRKLRGLLGPAAGQVETVVGEGFRLLTEGRVRANHSSRPAPAGAERASGSRHP